MMELRLCNLRFSIEIKQTIFKEINAILKEKKKYLKDTSITLFCGIDSRTLEKGIWNQQSQ